MPCQVHVAPIGYCIPRQLLVSCYEHAANLQKQCAQKVKLSKQYGEYVLAGAAKVDTCKPYILTTAAQLSFNFNFECLRMQDCMTVTLKIGLNQNTK